MTNLEALTVLDSEHIYLSEMLFIQVDKFSKSGSKESVALIQIMASEPNYDGLPQHHKGYLGLMLWQLSNRLGLRDGPKRNGVRTYFIA